MAMQHLEASIRDSIRQYGHILTLLHTINAEIGTASAEELQGMNTALTALQEQSKHHDQALGSRLNSEPVRTEAINSLLEKRERLIQEILQLNKNATAKAMGVKSLLAHEIGILRNGQSALSGYRPQQRHQGRIVNSTS